MRVLLIMSLDGVTNCLIATPGFLGEPFYDVGWAATRARHRLCAFDDFRTFLF